jgi:polar amino acid transport system substrate-binding protein
VPDPIAGAAIILVVSSLFLVSIFVATITSTMTVDALQDNVGLDQ